AIIKTGVVYALTAADPTPALGDGIAIEVDTTTAVQNGVFTISATGLTASSGYSFRAFATNSVGAGYSTVGTFTTPSATTAIIISEVNPSGNSNGTYAADWVELTNIGSATANISGWKMDDNSHTFANAVPLAGVTTIAPGQSVVFVEGDSTTASNF